MGLFVQTKEAPAQVQTPLLRWRARESESFEGNHEFGNPPFAIPGHLHIPHAIPILAGLAVVGNLLVSSCSCGIRLEVESGTPVVKAVDSKTDSIGLIPLVVFLEYIDINVIRIIIAED